MAATAIHGTNAPIPSGAEGGRSFHAASAHPRYSARAEVRQDGEGIERSRDGEGERDQRLYDDRMTWGMMRRMNGGQGTRQIAVAGRC
jgi:hypothetical protein